MKKIYVASKIKHASMWKQYRDNCKYNIISTWIDEAKEGETKDYIDLARRCIKESAICDFLVLYIESNDILKGALIEVGAALGAGKEVRFVEANHTTLKTIFKHHSLWKEFNSIDEALLKQ